jgi:hypothetical protein
MLYKKMINYGNNIKIKYYQNLVKKKEIKFKQMKKNIELDKISIYFYNLRIQMLLFKINYKLKKKRNYLH